MASQVALTTEVRADTEMVMKSHEDWGAYLTPAPLSIAVMGELVFISLSQHDFPIIMKRPKEGESPPKEGENPPEEGENPPKEGENPPKEGESPPEEGENPLIESENPPKEGENPPIENFQYMKHPDSFSASLMQVCNTGWHAFNDAHKNMDQIRLHTANIPDYMNKAVKYLFSDNDKIVGKLVPLQLENIEKISETCVTLATSVEEKFMEVINLIAELLEASTKAKGVYGAEKVRVEKELAISKEKEKRVEQMKEQLNEMMEMNSEEIKEAKEEYTKAMDSLPSGHEMINMDAYEAFMSSLTLRWVRSGKSASEKAREDARFRIEQRREQLNHAREAREKNLEEMKQSEKELTDILVDMSKCNLDKINFETTIEMLGKGLRAMTQVKTQWSNLVKFFQMISHIVSISFKGKVIKDFVDTADVAQELDFDEKLLLKDDMYQQAFKASNLAGLVNMLSGTYIEVSNNYLMDRVNKLGELMALDKDDKGQLEEKRKEMHESCKEAQEGILELVEKNKKEFDEETEARMLKIEGGLKAALPAPPQ